MTTYRASPDDLADLAASLLAGADELCHHGAAAGGVLSAHGYRHEAWLVGLQIEESQAWASRWAGSLRTRIALLENSRALPLYGTTVHHAAATALGVFPSPTPEWQLFAGAPAGGAWDGADPRVRPESLLGVTTPGVELARCILDALESGDLERIQALLDRLTLHMTDLAFLEDTFTTLDADVVGLLPTLLLDAGVAEADLHRYLWPIGSALAVLESQGHLPFTAAELMAGHEGFGVTPLAYLDFGEFSMDFLVAIAGPALVAYAEDELPLRGPASMMPDGSVAPPDPRLALVRALLDLEPREQRSALVAVAGEGLMPALLSPATPWGDGGVAVAELLTSLAGINEYPSSLAVAHAMDAVTVVTSTVIVAALTTAVVPHFPSLIHGGIFTDLEIEIERTELRAALDTLPNDGIGTVGNFLRVATSEDEARRLLHQALAALINGTITRTFDPAHPHALGEFSDDLGAITKLVLDAQLSADMGEGERKDRETDFAMEILELAFGLVGTAAAAVIKASGFVAWAMEEAAGSSGVSHLAAGEAGMRTDNTVRALEDAMLASPGIRDFAMFALAYEMHVAGLLELPESLLAEGELVVPQTKEDWAALNDAVQAAGLNPETWFNDAAAIASYGFPDPVNG